MKKIWGMIIIFFINPVFADLIGSANKAQGNLSKLAMAVAPIGIIIAGIYFVLGKHDAGQKMTGAIIGVICIMAAVAIVQFARGFF